MMIRSAVLSVLIICLLIPSIGFAQSQSVKESQITISSSGWNLTGDLLLPKSGGEVPAVLLLHKANGDRQVYTELANELAKRGIASLRLDLRGHGASTNLGKFEPGKNNPDPLIWDAEQDVMAALRYMKMHPRLDSTRLGAVGASYSGEELAEAGRQMGFINAYVELSPGSFSDESIAGIDTSGVPWLFIVSNNERYLTQITQAVREKSKSVELVVIPGTAHASDILEYQNGITERIAVWLASNL